MKNPETKGLKRGTLQKKMSRTDTELETVAHTYNPSMWQVEEGRSDGKDPGSWITGSRPKTRETTSQQNNTKQKY